MKNKIIILLSSFLFAFSSSNQIDSYKEALGVILESEEYCSLTKSKKKYYVSNELLLYTRLGQYFTKELKKYDKPLSDEDIALDDSKNNLENNDLLKLNVKNRFDVQINFSEEKGGIFFAELLESKRKRKYNNIYFGISYVYMFKKKNDSVELVKIIQLDNN